MSEIWIVEGSSGEYSDHREWPVKAFRSNAKAQRLVVEAQARANELAAFKTDIGWEKWRDMTVTNPIPAALNEFDSNCDSDGTHYTCYAIELDED